MDYHRCPGHSDRILRAAIYLCPQCGNEVEIFSDEARVRCRRCGQHVYRERTPSCIEWCAAARQCLGEERWRELTEGKPRQ